MCSAMEMPTPCTSCGRMVELEDMYDGGELYCKTCWPVVEADRAWEEVAEALDMSAAVDTEWGVRFKERPGTSSFVSLCAGVENAREHLVNRREAGHDVELVARRVITGPWEAR